MSSLKTYDTFTVGKTNPIIIGATPEAQKRVVNASGGKFFYKATSDVKTSDTEVAVASSVTTESVIFLISESETKVIVETVEGPTLRDVTITDALTVSGATTLSGATTITGASAPTGAWAGSYAPVAATTGTDTAFAEKKLFVSSIYLPANKTLTGIGFLLGSEGGTNKLVAGLFSSSGEPLAKTSETTEGTVAGTKETIQEIAFTSEYAATGPARYFVGITGNGTTAKFRSIPANTAGKNVLAGEVELATKNTLAKFTAPTTFTGGKGPVSFVY